MSQSSRVAIIIGVYNKGAYLEQCLQSVAKQGRTDLETIIVNDGSTDDSSSIMARMPALFPQLNIRMFSKPNSGAAATRNYAISQSRSELLLNLDADDLIKDNFLNQAINHIDAGSSDIVYSDLELFGEKSGEWTPQPCDPFYIRFDNCVPALALYRRSVWDRVGGFNVALPFCEDWNFFIKAAAVGARFHKISGKFFAYRQTLSGLYNTFIRDKWEFGFPLMATAESDLYSVESVLWACDKLCRMPETWRMKFEFHEQIFKDNWLIQFWLGLANEGLGDLDRAIQHYSLACSLEHRKAWAATFRLGQLLLKSGAKGGAGLLHKTRILRPDMDRFIKPLIGDVSIPLTEWSLS